ARHPHRLFPAARRRSRPGRRAPDAPGRAPARGRRRPRGGR
ncbi:MAG: Phosphatidylserine decarboxylase, partial [uncultured Pseudonocardia sp.]